MPQEEDYSTTAMDGTASNTAAHHQNTTDCEALSSIRLEDFMKRRGPYSTVGTSCTSACQGQIIQAAKQHMAEKLADFDRAFETASANTNR